MNSTISARDVIQLKRNIKRLNTTIVDLLLSAKNETLIRDEEHIAPTHANTEAVRMMHLSPRFGRTNNFLSIMSFDHSKTTNYVTGHVAVINKNKKVMQNTHVFLTPFH